MNEDVIMQVTEEDIARANQVKAEAMGLLPGICMTKICPLAQAGTRHFGVPCSVGVTTLRAGDRVFDILNQDEPQIIIYWDKLGVMRPHEVKLQEIAAANDS